MTLVEGLCYQTMKGIMVTVYTLPSCVQCDSTKRFLKKNDIAYEEVDLSTDAEAMESIRAMGYTAAPVVQVGEKHWSGFRFELLKELVA